MDMLERRVTLLGVLRAALNERDVLVRIGAENERARAALARTGGRRVRTAAAPARDRVGDRTAAHGLRPAIHAVRDAAAQLSSFIGEVYDER